MANKKRTEITLEMAKYVYSIWEQINNNEITKEKGIELLVKEFGEKKAKSSLKMYLNNFYYLIKGEKYPNEMKEEYVDYYLLKFEKYLDGKYYKNVKESIKKRKIYLEHFNMRKKIFKTWVNIIKNKIAEKDGINLLIVKYGDEKKQLISDFINDLNQIIEGKGQSITEEYKSKKEDLNYFIKQMEKENLVEVNSDDDNKKPQLNNKKLETNSLKNTSNLRNVKTNEDKEKPNKVILIKKEQKPPVEQYKMNVDYFEIINKAFRTILPPLSQYIVKMLKENDNTNWWLRFVKNKLSESAVSNLPQNGNLDECAKSLDIQACLMLIINNWKDIFQKKLSNNHKNWAHELKTLRNDIDAHYTSKTLDTFNERDLIRGIDTMILFIEPINNDISKKINSLLG